MAGKPSKPTFFWQGLLILLPVLLMAGFGTWAILREHRAVEQDARQRAREIVDSLPYNFFGRVASRMGMLTTQSAETSLIPGNRADLQMGEADGGVGGWGAAGNLMPDAFTNILWTSLPGEIWPMNFLLDAKGNVWDLTYQEAPQPPPWLAEMDEKQKAAWGALRESDLNRHSALEISQLAETFLDTSPSDAAREVAEFIRLRAQSSSQSDADAANALLAFGKNCSDVMTDSGVPLSNLVLAEALRHAGTGGTNDAALHQQLEFEVRYRPSLLTSALLDQAQRVVGTDAKFAKSLTVLHAMCDARATQRELAMRIKWAGVGSDVGTITNVWINSLDQRWFCVLQPERVLTLHVIPSGETNQAVLISTNVFTEVIPYSESFLTKSFSEALEEARISLPDYFEISMELEGWQIALPMPWSKSPAAMLAGQTLTEAQTNLLEVLSQVQTKPPAKDILAEQQVSLSLPASRPDEGPFGTNAGPRDFDAMPSHPQLTFSVLLANRALLYARQNQRQAIFGGLMVFSVAAALVGFIAARRAFRTQLRLSEAKSNFVSSVSHELRAPIASVRLMAESLERGKVAGGEKQNEYYRFIVQECRRLSSLIENVLDFSRIEQGRKQYEFEPTDVAALTRETVKLMEPYAEEKGVKLEFNSKLETRNPELEMDGRAIQQALVNLIDNAIKHSAKGQTVTVGLDCGDRRTGILPVSNLSAEKNDSETGRMPVLLYVEDHGAGIPQREHEKIFERFYRLGPELRRETQGVGIGLSIVRHIVEAHGGKVTVRSNIGEGSRFTIVLPRN